MVYTGAFKIDGNPSPGSDVGGKEQVATEKKCMHFRTCHIEN